MNLSIPLTPNPAQVYTRGRGSNSSSVLLASLRQEPALGDLSTPTPSPVLLFCGVSIANPSTLEHLLNFFREFWVFLKVPPET